MRKVLRDGSKSGEGLAMESAAPNKALRKGSWRQNFRSPARHVLKLGQLGVAYFKYERLISEAEAEERKDKHLSGIEVLHN